MMLKCEIKAKREIAGRVSLITKSGEVYIKREIDREIF